MSDRVAAERTTVPKPLRPLLATHSGSFHLDDAFAYAVLRLALSLGAAGGDHALARTRDEAVVAAADVAWDVGAVYNPAAGRFDHHQRGAPAREDGLPYSAAGLVRLDEVTGGTPYGASTIAGGKGERQPSGNELELARFQGRHVAGIARALAAARLKEAA